MPIDVYGDLDRMVAHLLLDVRQRFALLDEESHSLRENVVYIEVAVVDRTKEYFQTETWKDYCSISRKVLINIDFRPYEITLRNVIHGLPRRLGSSTFCVMNVVSLGSYFLPILIAANSRFTSPLFSASLNAGLETS